MTFISPDLGAAASFYLALYILFVLFMTGVMCKKGFMTVYTFLWIFGIIRTGGQVCAVMYAKLGLSHYKLLIAYLVLGAEGYFTLILSAFQITCKGQIRQFGFLWILTLGPPILFRKQLTWRFIFHLLLVLANVFIIAGGSMLAKMSREQLQSDHKCIEASRGLLCAGLAIFVFMTVSVVALNIYVYVKVGARNNLTICVICASPFLLVRGIFGILSIYVAAMDYFDRSNYTAGGSMSHKLTIYEYVLSVTMEFVASCCLTSTLWFDREDERAFENPDENELSDLEDWR